MMKKQLNTRMIGFKNILRVLVVSFSLLFPLASKPVPPLYVFPNGLLFNPPVCHIETSIILYSPRETEYFLNHGVIMASAGYEKGIPGINFDKNVIPTTHPVFQFFVFLHECSHFRLNNIFTYKGIETEYETDCHAAKTAREYYDFTEDDFRIIKEHILDDDLRVFASGMDIRVLEDTSYDPKARVENLESCLKE